MVAIRTANLSRCVLRCRGSRWANSALIPSAQTAIPLTCVTAPSHAGNHTGSVHHTQLQPVNLSSRKTDGCSGDTLKKSKNVTVKKTKWCIRQVSCDFSEFGALHGVPVRAGEVAMTLRVRALSEEEVHRLARMTRSQKLGAGLVRRARIIQHAVDGLSAPGIAAKMGLCGATGRFWLKRFNERGFGGVGGGVGSGGPPAHTPR